MNSNKVAVALNALFNRYIQAFEQFDNCQASSCYVTPCSLSTPDSLKVLADEKSLEAEFYDIFNQLKNLTFKTVLAYQASFDRVSNELILVNIHWQFFDEADIMFTDFTALYHVIVKGDSLVIANVISHHADQYKSLKNKLEVIKG